MIMMHYVIICAKLQLKVKGHVQLLMKLHVSPTGCHLPYGITQCYLSPDKSEHSPP